MPIRPKPIRPTRRPEPTISGSAGVPLERWRLAVLAGGLEAVQALQPLLGALLGAATDVVPVAVARSRLRPWPLPFRPLPSPKRCMLPASLSGCRQAHR